MSGEDRNGWTWFRLYAETVDDEKLRLLAFEDRWHFIALLCCKARGILDVEDADLRLRMVAVKLGLDLRELAEVARRLATVGLIEEQSLSPLAWNRRQFISDHDPTARERLKKFREKKKLERATDLKRVAKRICNGDETRSETETETDTEQRQRKEKNTSPSAPSDVSPSVWNDWTLLRKQKKAAVTATAIAGIRREAEKANLSLEDALRICCERGWSGFKAEWVSKSAGGRSKYEEQADRVIRMLDQEVIDG